MYGMLIFEEENERIELVGQKKVQKENSSLMDGLLPRQPLPLHSFNVRSTSEVLRKSTFLFISSFFTFLFLSLFLLGFRYTVENGSYLVATFIDSDSSLRSRLHHFDLQKNKLRSQSTTPVPQNHLPILSRRRIRRPFLHISRVGALDDDFFAVDDDSVQSSFRHGRGAEVNRSYIKLGFISDDVEEPAIDVREAVRRGILFKLEKEEVGFDEIGDDRAEKVDNFGVGSVEEGKIKGDGGNYNGGDGLELDKNDALSTAGLLFFFSAAYGWTVLVFFMTYSWVLGIVFVAVVGDLLGRFNSICRNICHGFRLGVTKLSWFMIMRWAVRDAVTQLLGVWFFGEIEDQHLFFRLFVRLKLMPFSVMSPGIGGMEREIARFLSAWFLVDGLIAFILVLVSWVAVVDGRTGGEVLKEGCHLLNIMMMQAVQIKCLEIIVTGSVIRLGLEKFCGKFSTDVLQSLIEVYFMVVWLIVYFAARFKDDNSGRRRFDHRDLEGFDDGIM